MNLPKTLPDVVRYFTDKELNKENKNEKGRFDSGKGLENFINLNKELKS